MNAKVLARLRVIRGRSDAEQREFASSRGQTSLLTVGADAQCDWCVQEVGVSPIHFSLHWDGSTLRIANTHGAGETRVNGALLGADWQVLDGRTRIEFGRAVIVLEAQRAHSAHPPAALAEVAPVNDRARPSSARPLAAGGGSVRPSAIAAQSGGERSVAARASMAYAETLGVEGSAAVQRTTSPPAANPEPRTGPVPRAAVRFAEAEPARAEPQPEASQRGQESAVAAEASASEPDASATVSNVFVLGAGGRAGGAAERPFVGMPRVKPASRRSVWLSGLALLGGYALWVYLLHQL